MSGPDEGKIHAILLTPANESIGGRLQISHVHTRIPFCPRMLAATICRDSDSADSSDKGAFFGARAPSSYMLRVGARPEIVRDNMGHVEYRRDPELHHVRRQ